MDILVTKEVAVRLRCSERTACRLFQRREIAAFQLTPGGDWRTTDEELTRYLARKLSERKVALLHQERTGTPMSKAPSGLGTLRVKESERKEKPDTGTSESVGTPY
jgi:excisionase family DNA binding protein